MKNKITVILVDDHTLFREGLQFLLSKLENIEVIAQAQNGRQYLELLKDQKPDITLMDINMPEMDGEQATKLALELYPDLKIITLSMNGDEAYYYKMIHAGVKGFVLKQAGSSELEEAIKTVMKGGDFFSQELMKNLILNIGKSKKINSPQESKYIQLTEREQEVLELICHGMSMKEIGDKLFISPRTVEGHKARLMEKTGAKNISNLIILAIKNKLIEI